MLPTWAVPGSRAFAPPLSWTIVVPLSGRRSMCLTTVESVVPHATPIIWSSVTESAKIAAAMRATRSSRAVGVASPTGTMWTRTLKSSPMRRAGALSVPGCSGRVMRTSPVSLACASSLETEDLLLPSCRAIASIVSFWM